MLDAAQRRFRATGLDAPWYPALGNHDVLVQGEVPPTPAIEARGDRRPDGRRLDPRLLPPILERRARRPSIVDSLLAGRRVLGRTRDGAGRPARRHLRAGRVVAAAARPPRACTGRRRLDYAFDIGPSVRGIVLDTVDRAGGSRGLVTPAQLAWLRGELRRARRSLDRRVLPQPLTLRRRRGGAAPRSTPTRASSRSSRGNSHRNAIEPPRGGYWLIATSSLADFPQQARMFRLREAPGGVVLETWMVDQDGRGLAGVSRELAYLDAQGGRPQGFAGRPTDRNARLFVQP